MTNLAELASMIQDMDQQNHEAALQAQTTIDRLTRELREVRVQLAAAEASQAPLPGLTAQLGQAAARNQDLEQELKATRDQLRLSEERLAHLPDFAGQRQDFDNAAAELRGQLEAARKRVVELEGVDQAQGELQNKLLKTNEYVRNLQAELEQSLQQRLEAETRLEHLPDYAGLKAEYDRSYAALEARLKETEKQLTDIADLKKASAGYQDSLHTAQARKRATDQELDEARKALYAAERQLADLPDFGALKQASDSAIAELRRERDTLLAANAEFKKQAAALKKQTALAERASSLAGELKSRLAGRDTEIARLQQELASIPQLGDRDARHQAQIDAYAVALKQANLRAEEKRDRLAQLEAREAQGERALQEATELRASLDSSRTLNRDLTERLATFDSLVETKATLEKGLDELQRRLTLADKEIFRLSQDDSAARRFEDDRRGYQRAIEDLKTELERVRQELARQEAANTALKEGVGRQELALDAYKDRVAAFTERDNEVTRNLEELVRLRAELQEAGTGYKRVSEQYENLVQQHLAVKEQSDTFKRNLGALRYQETQQKETITRLTGQLETARGQLQSALQAKETGQKELVATIGRLQTVDRDRGYRMGQLETEVANLKMRLEHGDDILRNMLLYLTRVLNQQKNLGLNDFQISSLVVETLKQKHVITGLVAQGKGS